MKGAINPKMIVVIVLLLLIIVVFAAIAGGVLGPANELLSETKITDVLKIFGIGK